MGNLVSKVTAEKPPFLDQLALPIFEKCLSYVSVQDLINLEKAYPQLAPKILALIIHKRTLTFAVSNCTTRSRSLVGFITNRFVLTVRNNLQTLPEDLFAKSTAPKRKVYNDKPKGWSAVLKQGVLGALKPYANLRSLKMRGCGMSGGALVLKPKWLIKLSTSLPQLECLSIFQGVLLTDSITVKAGYSSPAGIYRLKVMEYPLAATDLADASGLLFPCLKTLKLGHPTKALLDLLARPSVVPLLERLFIMSTTYKSKETLERFTRVRTPTLKEIMNVPCKTDSNTRNHRNRVLMCRSPGPELVRFLEANRMNLEAFCWEPIGPEIIIEVVQALALMPKLRKAAVCQPKDAPKPADQNSYPLASNYCTSRPAYQNLTNLFLDCGMGFPSYLVNRLIRMNTWTLRTFKLWYGKDLQSEDLRQLAKCQNLQKMEFFQVTALNVLILEDILAANKDKLRVLIIKQCDNLSKSRATVVVNAYCPKIQKFFISDGRSKAYEQRM